MGRNILVVEDDRNICDLIQICRCRLPDHSATS